LHADQLSLFCVWRCVTCVAGGDLSSEASWHGAEAYHFLLLAQRQMYAGHYGAAMITVRGSALT